MQAISLTIQGAPVPWKSHGGSGKYSYNPRFAEKEYYQFQLKQQYHQNFPIILPVKITYFFYLPIPESFSERKKRKILAERLPHTKKPDTTNLQKFCEDTLKGIVIRDDSLVVKIAAEKMYSENPRTEIQIELV